MYRYLNSEYLYNGRKKSKHEFRKYHLFSDILAKLKYITTK
ncbi:MAG: glycosyltransferase family 8 C-terminal domain-containing protein [Symbiopectobacterium sp.]